jgi:hypothetical protein
LTRTWLQDCLRSFTHNSFYSMDLSKPAYDTLPLAEDHDRSDSNTEVDESLMGDEHQWHSKTLESANYKRRTTCISRLRSYRWLVDTFLLLIILLLLVIILLRGDAREGWSSSRRQIGGDYKGAGLTCQCIGASRSPDTPSLTRYSRYESSQVGSRLLFCAGEHNRVLLQQHTC